MFLDGDTFLDLPGMLRYVHTLPPLPLILYILHIYCIHIHTLLTTRLITSTFQPPPLPPPSTPLYTSRYTGAGGSGSSGSGGGTSKDSGGTQTRTSPRKPFERLDEENSPARPLLNRISNQLIRDVCTMYTFTTIYSVYTSLYSVSTTVRLFVLFGLY